MRLPAFVVFEALVLVSRATNIEVPVILMRLYNQSEKTLGRMHGISRSNSNGHLQSLAQSFASSSKEQGEENDMKLQFALPNNNWSRKANVNWWLVVCLNYNTTSSVILEHNEIQTQEVSLRPNQLFAYFNITEFGQKHIGTNVIFKIKTKDLSGSYTDARNAVITSDIKFEPVLVLSIRELFEQTMLHFPKRGRRRQRNILEIDNSTSCRLHPWTVRPELLGVDSIVYPNELPLNLCIGECPMPLIHSSLNPTNHAMARNIYRFMNISNRSLTAGHPEIQCVPISFRVISLLMVEESLYKLVIANDLAVATCGCR